MENAEEMGKTAHHKQVWGQYEEAIEIYTKSIKKHGIDARLLNNRCMCYLELRELSRALEDADTLIQLFPNYARGYFRKGEILKYKKCFAEAEEAFQQVLKLEPNCEDAKLQLHFVQVAQICINGPYTETQATRAITSSASRSVEEALRLLKLGILDQHSTLDPQDDEVFYSDDETSAGSPSKAEDYDIFTDPSNLLGSSSLWIGINTEGVTEKMMTDIFSKYGKLKSVKVNHDRKCVFVNYFDTIAPGKAMKALQGNFVWGKKVLIKFPDNSLAQTHLVVSKKRVKHI